MWQFPDASGKLNPQDALAYLEENGIKCKELLKQVERQHIFTHRKWDMRGYYIDVKEQAGQFCWFTAEEIESETALPTAYRKFWDIHYK